MHCRTFPQKESLTLASIQREGTMVEPLGRLSNFKGNINNFTLLTATKVVIFC